MAEIYDDDYGRIVVRRNKKSRHVKLSVSPSGELSLSAPFYTPLSFLKLFIKKSRRQISQLIEKHQTLYLNDCQIGKSHQLHIIKGYQSKVTYKKPVIEVEVLSHEELQSVQFQHEIKKNIIKALKNEAKAYLPRRIEYLANAFDFSYQKLRFSHAKSRWGSCSSEGVISLNIALMKLDFELIDYVVIHELVHTEHLNHGQLFWERVEACDPDYKTHRKALKEFYPHI